MALVPPSKWTAAAAGGLNPGASTGGAGSSPWFVPTGTISSVGSETMAGYAAVQLLTWSSTTWPVASAAILLPFSIQSALTVQRCAWSNGAAVSGNVDCGIYNEDGTRVVSLGSTAQAGVNSVQTATLSASLVAGSYFMALALDNTTGTILATAPASASIGRCVGIQWATTFFPLGATATFANPTNAYIPQFCLGLQTTI